jgi:hypothetical protein
MINFPAGYVDEHGFDLSNAVGVVNQLNYGTHANRYSTFLNGEYVHRNDSNSSASYRVDVYVSQAAFDAKKRPLYFTINGMENFSVSNVDLPLTFDELLAFCEADLLARITPS